MSDYKYLGTILNSKLKFTNNTSLVVKNTRKKLHIMSKLRYLGTSDQLRLNCYKTFIENSLLFHMTIIYHRMSDKDNQELMSVKKSAEKLSKLKLLKPSDTINHRIHNKAWSCHQGGIEQPSIGLTLETIVLEPRQKPFSKSDLLVK